MELGKISNIKIRHDNKGGGAAWFLDHVEIIDPKRKKPYYFPCQRWLATDKDDGQIYRVLVPGDRGKGGRVDGLATQGNGYGHIMVQHRSILI